MAPPKQNKTSLKRLYIVDSAFFSKLYRLYLQNKKLEANKFEKRMRDVLFNKSLARSQKRQFFKNILSKHFKKDDTSSSKWSAPLKTSSQASTASAISSSKQPETNHSIENSLDRKLMSDQSFKNYREPDFYDEFDDEDSDNEENLAFRHNKQRSLNKKGHSAQKVIHSGKEDIFEHDTRSDSEDLSGVDEVDDDDDYELNVSRLADRETENRLRQVAQAHLGEQSDHHMSVDESTINKDYRVFHNSKTNDSIAVEVEPILNEMRFNTKPPQWEVEETDKDVSRVVPGRYIRLRGRDVARRSSIERKNFKRKQPDDNQTWGLIKKRKESNKKLIKWASPNSKN